MLPAVLQIYDIISITKYSSLAIQQLRKSKSANYYLTEFLLLYHIYHYMCIWPINPVLTPPKSRSRTNPNIRAPLQRTKSGCAATFCRPVRNLASTRVRELIREHHRIGRTAIIIILSLRRVKIARCSRNVSFSPSQSISSATCQKRSSID